MGGFGSGGRNATGAATCESCLSIDLAWLRRRGMLQLGRHSPLTWSLAGEQTGSIMIAQHDGVRLRYQTKDRDGLPVDVNELVPFVYTPTRFGGRRQWLRCLKCGRGCRKIYGGRYSAAGYATACDTPRRAKKRISAPRTELARLPSACTTSGAVPPRTNTTSRRNRRACAGPRTTASRRNTTIWKIGGPWAS
jgi:hypothetical protein